MTKEERKELAQKIMEEEAKGMSYEMEFLGECVLTEVLRLQSEGETAEAKAFEVFLPIDEVFLSSIVPMVGQDEFEKMLAIYKEEKRKQRLAYLEE